MASINSSSSNSSTNSSNSNSSSTDEQALAYSFFKNVQVREPKPGSIDHCVELYNETKTENILPSDKGSRRLVTKSLQLTDDVIERLNSTSLTNAKEEQKLPSKPTIDCNVQFDKMSNIYEEDIMSKFLVGGSPPCNCHTCLNIYNNTSPNNKYYSSKLPPKMMDIVNNTADLDKMKKECSRLIDIFEQFDTYGGRQPGEVVDSDIEEVKKKTKKNKPSQVTFDKSNIPNDTVVVKHGWGRGKPLNEADDYLFWLCVDNLAEYGKLRDIWESNRGGNTLENEYDPNKDVNEEYIDEETGEEKSRPYLGGVYYNGERVKGNKWNVLIMVSNFTFCIIH